MSVSVLNMGKEEPKKKRTLGEWVIHLMDKLDDLARWINGNKYWGMQPFAEARRFIQRGVRGYDETCYWSVDDWLCEIVPPVLDELAEKVHGVPPMLVDEQEDDENNEAVNKAAVVWAGMIRQMADGFRAHKELDDADWSDKELMARLQKKRDDGLQLFVKWFGHLWD